MMESISQLIKVTHFSITIINVCYCHRCLKNGIRSEFVCWFARSTILDMARELISSVTPSTTGPTDASDETRMRRGSTIYLVFIKYDRIDASMHIDRKFLVVRRHRSQRQVCATKSNERRQAA